MRKLVGGTMLVLNSRVAISWILVDYCVLSYRISRYPFDFTSTTCTGNTVLEVLNIDKFSVPPALKTFFFTLISHCDKYILLSIFHINKIFLNDINWRHHSSCRWICLLYDNCLRCGSRWGNDDHFTTLVAMNRLTW